MTKGSGRSERDSKSPARPTINVTDGTLIPLKDEGGVLSAWNISFFGAIALLVALPLFSPDPYLRILSFVPDGLFATFSVTIISICFALIIGLFAGLGRISQRAWVNRIATVYVEIIRGIPLLVQLFYIYYALGPLLRLQGPPAAILAMSICYGAYMAEIFRAGIQAIPKGQMEAALALGMSRSSAMRMIIIPQTIRVILPPIGNEFIALLKDSSLVSILAVSDLLRRGREYASTSFRYFESYTVIALIYLVMTLFFSRLVAIMEERLRHRGNVH
ncbi:MAG: amino acid ABC transporter permease [Spirochaetia bacterium]|jgi:polar amino acid transport system permease protein|nr:amino acid ABC transporter permease [Spirochaetia bacterium]